MTIDELYGVPLEDFVAARDELAKELIAAGDGDEAKRVKSLRKPTATAWALNRLARERPELMAALVDAHAGLRSADSAPALRAASEARMAAIQLIIGAPEGVTEAVRKKMRSTLLATATDPAAEEALIAGRLNTELEPGGLGGFDMGSGFTTTTPGPADGFQVQGWRPNERRASRRAPRRSRPGNAWSECSRRRMRPQPKRQPCAPRPIAPNDWRRRPKSGPPRSRPSPKRHASNSRRTRRVGCSKKRHCHELNHESPSPAGGGHALIASFRLEFMLARSRP